mgnify:FL=1
MFLEERKSWVWCTDWKRCRLEHKAAIDRHLEASGIPILHTAVFWGERSEIKPSEISPELYRKWMEK